MKLWYVRDWKRVLNKKKLEEQLKEAMKNPGVAEMSEFYSNLKEGKKHTCVWDKPHLDHKGQPAPMGIVCNCPKCATQVIS